MASLGLRLARAAALGSTLLVGCFHDNLAGFQPVGGSTGASGSTTAGATTGADTTEIVTTGTDGVVSTGDVAGTSTTGTSTTGPLTTAPETTGPRLDMGGPAPYTCPADQAVVACYLFEDGWDDNVLVDGGPANLDGVMYGATPVAGYRGLAAGSGFATELSVSSPELLRTEQWTVTAWVRLDHYPAGARCGVLDRDGDYGIFILASGVVHCGGTVGLDSLSKVSPGTWTHLACQWDKGKGIRVFVDGKLEAEVPWQDSVPAADPTLVIANDSPPSVEEALPGAVDEVIVWRKVLSADELCVLAGC